MLISYQSRPHAGDSCAIFPGALKILRCEILVKTSGQLNVFEISTQKCVPEMKSQTGKSYTRFTILTDADSTANARKNYLVWIMTVSVLFCMTAAYFYYKTVLAPASVSDQISHSTTDASVATISVPKQSEFKLYNPKPLLARFRKHNGDTPSEFTCEESHPRSQAIPQIYIERIFQKDFENIYDLISLDLLLHYDNIINEFRPNYLKSIFNKYQSNWLLVRNSRDFVNFLRILNSNKFKFYADYLNRQRLELEIKQFQSYFALTEELNQWYNYLVSLGRFLSRYEQQKLGKYFQSCSEKNFKNYTEETQKRMFHFVYPFSITDKKLEEVNDVINEWGSSVKTEKIYNTSIVFYNRVILLSQINKELLRLDRSRLNSVYIYASHTVYLDEDVELFGVNLAIIAPRWIFLKKIKINLNGITGEAITGPANHNEAGKPGYPGGNAGDFLGIGNLHEKFLQISADGGKGGNGQNGTNGRDGVDNTFPAPPVDKPSACAIKIKSFNDTFRQKITHYEIYSVEGCGGRGTDGGVGGSGGYGGVITLIGKEGINVRKGLKGTVGLPGKGGAGGAGGRNGCFYEVLDVDDEILHPVTRVKCPRGNILPRGDFGKDDCNTRGQIFPPAKESLKVGNSLFQFIRMAGEALIKYNDADVASFLKEMNQGDLSQYEVTDIISEYESIKDFNRIEFFDILKEKITRYTQQPSKNSVQSILKHLESIVLGEMTILKSNINYFFIDFKNYLNLIKKNINNTNENTRNFQSISYLKQKVGTKQKMMAESLKVMRITALGLGPNSRHTKQLSRGAEGRKLLCVLITTIDVFYTLLNQPSKHLKNFESDNVPEFCSITTKEADKGRYVLTNLTKEEKNVFTCLENLSNKSKQDVRGRLTMLKESLYTLKESEIFPEDENNLLEALTDNLEHFMALYYFTEWEEIGNLFLKSLANLTESSVSTGNEEIKFLKSRLVDIMIGVQYKLAIDASRQNLNHFINTNTGHHLLQKSTTADDVTTQISLLQDLVDRDTDSFCKNHLKAVFGKDSAVGEFYFWSNEQIKNELQNLFSGAEINLKSNLINRHVFDKNYVQFTSIKLEFECNGNGILCEKQIHKFLSNFKIEMTHSGYSYYNWKGDTHIVVSEKLSLEYSFSTRGNGQPEVYNELFKKCQAGEIKLSPFTTWSIRLLPINDDADFNKLSNFAQTVNLRLTGTGTYIS